MAKQTIERTHLTPPVLAQRWGMSTDTILHFIHNGELEAVNLGKASRPRWRISKAAEQAFLKARSNQSVESAR